MKNIFQKQGYAKDFTIDDMSASQETKSLLYYKSSSQRVIVFYRSSLLLGRVLNCRPDVERNKLIAFANLEKATFHKHVPWFLLHFISWERSFESLLNHIFYMGEIQRSIQLVLKKEAQNMVIWVALIQNFVD